VPAFLADRFTPVYRGVLALFTRDMQSNIPALLDVKACVVKQMMQDRALLGELFRRCGRAELAFLTNSGLWFGFLLGLIQMVVALFVDNPWTLSVGGGVVGLATNWLALKWIFSPVNPVKVGPFVFQGLFLTRQNEVAKEFSSFFANNILTSERMWTSILTEAGTRANFVQLLSRRLGGSVSAAATVATSLPSYLHKVRPERSGGAGRSRGSMMTYKTRGCSTIMRVAGSATSAMRKPQNGKRVRNDEA
jgi:uncharacterized membrane protein YheB (UPF0754 family)